MPGRERRSRRGQIYKRMMAGKVGEEKPKDVKKEDSKKGKAKKEKKEESDESKE